MMTVNAGGGSFGDIEEDLQVAVQAVRVQTWWNSWSSTKSELKRREVYPVLGILVCKLTLLQPSSAAAERVFSILVQRFGKTHVGALEDYKQAVVMLKYNQRKV